MHEPDDVDETDDDHDQNCEGRHEMSDEDCRRDEDAKRRQRKVAVKLLRYDLVRLPTCKPRGRSKTLIKL